MIDVTSDVAERHRMSQPYDSAKARFD